MEKALVEIKNVDMIFGGNQNKALELLDRGKDRGEILQETGNTVGVHNASVEVNRGEICVLMGLSGSGKSTLLRCVNGLNQPTRGEILIHREGKDTINVANCSASTLRELRTHTVSMVFQQFGLLPWRTVEENVGLGLELQGMPKAKRALIVQEQLKLVHLTEWKDMYVKELSGGMQQRVGLARAFATNADILLMDEPFSALDPLIRNHLQDELLELQSTLHKTIIFVSHDLDEAVKLGTHIAIMKDGKVMQYGKPEEIILYPANDYVAEFVAHLNPLNALTGKALMCPLSDLKKEGDEYLLDRWGWCRLKVDESGVPKSICIDQKEGDFLPYQEDMEFKKSPNQEVSNQLLLAPPDIKMKEIIRYRVFQGNPSLIVEDGKVVGVVNDEQVYEGLLGK